jgi:hypothetical protein
MKKATTTTPDPELSTPLGSENEGNPNPPRTPQPGPQQAKQPSTEAARVQDDKCRQQPQWDLCRGGRGV